MANLKKLTKLISFFKEELQWIRSLMKSGWQTGSLSLNNVRQGRKDKLQNSGLANAGISEKNYYYWQRKVRQEVYVRAAPVILPAVRNDDPATFAEIPVQQFQNTEQAGLPFHADAVIHAGNFTVGLSNSVSESLLKHILEAVHVG